MSSTRKRTWRMPRALAGAGPSSLSYAGVRYLASSSLVSPSGVRSITMSERTPARPLMRSTKSPSTVASPSTSSPRATKNAVAASMSSTTIPMCSSRWTVMKTGSSSRSPVANVGGERRVEHLDRLEPEGLDSVEQSLAGPEQDGGHVEREFVDHCGGERLTDGRGAARNVDAILAGRLTRLRIGGLEALGDEVKARAALHLDRLARVVGEHEDRRVVGRLGPPPSIPVLIPLAADRPEHVAAHDVGPARSHEPALCRRVGVIRALVTEVPAVDLLAALAQRILPALVRSGDEAVERDRHVAGGIRHRRLPGIAICKRRHRNARPPAGIEPALRVSGTSARSAFTGGAWRTGTARFPTRRQGDDRGLLRSRRLRFHFHCISHPKGGRWFIREAVAVMAAGDKHGPARSKSEWPRVEERKQWLRTSRTPET